MLWCISTECPFCKSRRCVLYLKISTNQHFNCTLSVGRMYETTNRKNIKQIWIFSTVLLVWAFKILKNKNFEIQSPNVSVEIGYLKLEKVETVVVVGGARWRLMFVFTKTDCFFQTFFRIWFRKVVLRVLFGDLVRMFRMVIFNRPGNFPVTMHLLWSMRPKFSDVIGKNAFFDNPLRRRSKSMKNLIL